MHIVPVEVIKISFLNETEFMSALSVHMPSPSLGTKGTGPVLGWSML